MTLPGQYCAFVVDKSPDEPSAEQLLRVAVRRDAAAIMVVVEGEVDLLTVSRLRAAVDEALRDAAGRPVVVDLTAVTFLGSHGLTALAEAASKAEQWREPLRVVVDETHAVIRPLHVTGLDEVLALYYSVGDALPQ
ncbi:MAG: STAS domain-containing protein [Pseudonocardiaceae bacterium]